jgi:OCT family organic cation transporter-like MFS transporter 4/5
MDLVCDRANLAELLQTLVFGGQLVGAAFASSISDRFGRKTVHLGSCLLTLVFGVGVAFSPNFLLLAILKFILGILQQVQSVYFSPRLISAILNWRKYNKIVSHV